MTYPFSSKSSVQRTFCTLLPAFKRDGLRGSRFEFAENKFYGLKRDWAEMQSEAAAQSGRVKTLRVRWVGPAALPLGGG